MPTRQKTNPNPNPEKSPQQRKNGGPSSEINLDEIFSLAREVDAQAQAEPEEPPAKRKRKRAANENYGKVAAEPEPVPVLPTDPEFEEMIHWGVGQAVETAKIKLDWSEPGPHWRQKVTVMIARLWVRLQPMSDSWVTDLITLGGYTALWVAPNVSNGVRKNPAPNRNDGNRQDLQDARTP